MPVELEVRWALDGGLALGPEELELSTRVGELKAQIQAEYTETASTCFSISILDGDRELTSSTRLSEFVRNKNQISLAAVIRELDYVERAQLLGDVEKDWRALGEGSSALASDRDAVWLAVIQDAEALQYASKALRADREFMERVVRFNGSAMLHASKVLRADASFARAVLGHRPYALKHVSRALQANKDVVMIAVRRDVYALQYADEALLTDKVFMRERVRDAMEAFQYAHDNLKADKDFVATAYKEDVDVLQYVCESLRSDRNFMLVAIRYHWKAFEYCGSRLKCDAQLSRVAADKAMDFASPLNDCWRGKDFQVAQMERRRALDFATSTLRAQRLRDTAELIPGMGTTPPLSTRPLLQQLGRKCADEQDYLTKPLLLQPAAVDKCNLATVPGPVRRLHGDIWRGRAIALSVVA